MVMSFSCLAEDFPTVYSSLLPWISASSNRPPLEVPQQNTANADASHGAAGALCPDTSSIPRPLPAQPGKAVTNRSALVEPESPDLGPGFLIVRPTLPRINTDTRSDSFDILPASHPLSPPLRQSGDAGVVPVSADQFSFVLGADPTAVPTPVSAETRALLEAQYPDVEVPRGRAAVLDFVSAMLSPPASKRPSSRFSDAETSPVRKHPTPVDVLIRPGFRVEFSNGGSFDHRGVLFVPGGVYGEVHRANRHYLTIVTDDDELREVAILKLNRRLHPDRSQKLTAEQVIHRKTFLELHNCYLPFPPGTVAHSSVPAGSILV